MLCNFIDELCRVGVYCWKWMGCVKIAHSRVYRITLKIIQFGIVIGANQLWLLQINSTSIVTDVT